MGGFGLVLALLVIAAGIAYRNRLHPRGGGPASAQLTDDMVRRIEAEGALDVEEPLDMEQIREEEERFWEEEPWEEPEEL